MVARNADALPGARGAEVRALRMVVSSGAMRERVCVIGAGPSGIAAAKAVLDAGAFELTV
jgi:hypothetical protein